MAPGCHIKAATKPVKYENLRTNGARYGVQGNENTGAGLFKARSDINNFFVLIVKTCWQTSGGLGCWR